MNNLDFDFKKNINLWENIGKSDPLWGVLTQKKMRNNKWDEDKFYNTGLKEIDKFLENLRISNSKKKIERVLDFGCGVGRITKYLSLKYKLIIALDISLSMLKFARIKNKNASNVLFIQSSSPQLSNIKEDKIDLIISIITFQHIPDFLQAQYLKGFSKKLSEDGLIYLQVVHGFSSNLKGILLRFFGNSLFKIYHKCRYKLDYPMKIFCISEKLFNKTLFENNLEILQKFPSNYSGRAFKSFIYLLKVKK